MQLLLTAPLCFSLRSYYIISSTPCLISCSEHIKLRTDSNIDSSLLFFFLLCRRHHHHHHRHYHLCATINLLVRWGMFVDYRGSYCWGFLRHTALNLTLYFFLSQVLEHNLNSSYVCAGLIHGCWVIHDWLQKDGDDQQNLISARFYVHWKFCFGRRISHGCWTLWQACDWVERSKINYLMSGFASKCLSASLSIFLGAWGSMVFIIILIEAVICLAALCSRWSLCW